MVFMREIILVHPIEGIYNSISKPFIPLALLSVSSVLIQQGYCVRIIDLRVTKSWRQELAKAVMKKPICVGITSMTGSQLFTAMEAAQIVRDTDSHVPIVWGGPHASLFPEPTIESPLVDILVRGEGEWTISEVVEKLESGDSLKDVKGIWYKAEGEIIRNPSRPFLDLDALPDIPYHLVDVEKHLHKYFSEERVIEVETSRGCPFACKFCYNKIYNNSTFRAQSPEKVVSNLKKLNRDYGITNFLFLDDAFFANLKRGLRIMELILAEGLSFKIGFQGIRVGHIAKMSDDELDMVFRAGARLFQFGVEYGSPRVLKLIDKRLTVDEVVEQNRRLVKYPELILLYNFMCGFPTETKKELLESTQLAWTILNENSSSLISPFHHYKHYPGTGLYELAKNESYKTPQGLKEWADFDWTEPILSQTPKGLMAMMKKVETVTILADRKMELQTDFSFIHVLVKLYRPLARFRLKNNFYALMPEQWLMNVFSWYQKSRSKPPTE